MLRKLNSNSRSGFTLVEIMIVVAIIALLATIAVPNFLRARKRSQATAVLEEMRVIDGAKDTYAIEANKPGSTVMTNAWGDLKPYFKAGSRLANLASPTDIMGNAITITTIDAPPTIDAATFTDFQDVLGGATAAKSFWGSFAK